MSAYTQGHEYTSRINESQAIRANHLRGLMIPPKRGNTVSPSVSVDREFWKCLDMLSNEELKEISGYYLKLKGLAENIIQGLQVEDHVWTFAVNLDSEKYKSVSIFQVIEVLRRMFIKSKKNDVVVIYTHNQQNFTLSDDSNILDLKIFVNVSSDDVKVKVKHIDSGLVDLSKVDRLSAAQLKKRLSVFK